MRLLLLAPIVCLAGAAAPAADRDGPKPTVAVERQRTGSMPVMDPTSAPGLACPPISRYHAMRRGERPGMRTLDQLPAADHYKAAYRRIDGCVAPIIAGFPRGRR